MQHLNTRWWKVAHDQVNIEGFVGNIVVGICVGAGGSNETPPELDFSLFLMMDDTVTTATSRVTAIRNIQYNYQL